MIMLKFLASLFLVNHVEKFAKLFTVNFFVCVKPYGKQNLYLI